MATEEAINAANAPKKTLGGKLANGLKKLFNHAVRHIIWMAPLMALGVLALSPAAATLPDLVMATLDSAWNMVSTAVTQGPGVIYDIASNSIGGDFSLNYAWGSASHGGGHSLAMGGLDPGFASETAKIWGSDPGSLESLMNSHPQ